MLDTLFLCKKQEEVFYMYFDYFYGIESEQFSFYRIPKMLFKDKQFKNISAEAKVLYGLMLDRMNLSQKNMWLDDENRVYIIYTIDDITEDFGCARQKAAKLLDELDKGCGLIERKRQGLGKPNIIYVKNFINEAQSLENSRSMKIINQEVCNSNFRKYENHTSRNMNIKLQEVPKSYSNNTDNNNTEYSDTYNNNTEIVSNPILSPFPLTTSPEKTDEIDWNDKFNDNLDIVKANIDYDALVNDYEKTWLDEIVSIMADVLSSDKSTIRINKRDYPIEKVKDRFLSINSTHIEYIYFSLRENSTKVRNIRAFLITTIYRSVDTADNWYRAKVQYDISKGG